MVERSVMRSSSEQGGGGGGGLSLPPGFRFHPTDEEVISSYLLNKLLDPEGFVSRAVGEVDLNSCEPRDLPSKAIMGEKEWYFFVHKDMKYPTGMRANRATREGYWKATGKDREIFSSTVKKAGAGAGAGGELVGMKKTLVFYTGRAPRGAKTNWVMHEFRLDGKSRHQTINNPKDEWVVCKVFNKKGEGKMTTAREAADDENSAGTATPNASSVVDGGEGAGDFLDSMSMIDGPLYFASSEYTSSFLPATTTATTTATTSAAVTPPYNADYYHYSVPTTAGSSFNAMPNYSLTNPAASNMQVHQEAAMANSSVPASSAGDIGSSWNMLNPAHGHGMGRSSSYNVNHLVHHRQDEQQAIVVKALGGVIGPNFGKGFPMSSTSATIAGVPPPPQSKLGSYDGKYAYGNYDLASSAAAAAKNFGARLY